MKGDEAFVKCAGCGKEQKTKETAGGAARTPMGWKNHSGLWCGDCWKSRYKLRAVTFPVDSVIGQEWKAFTTSLRNCWCQSTSLANWAMRQVALNEPGRLPSDKKLKNMPTMEPSLYQLFQGYHARGEWDGAAQSANCILRAVEALYREDRFEAVWLGEKSFRNYRYPFPYPVHNQGWTASWATMTDEQTGEPYQVPVVDVPMGGQRWQLRLRGHEDSWTMRRQIEAFRAIVSGEAVHGELALYRVRSSNGCHRRTATESRNGGGNTVHYRIMCKLVAWLPREVRDRPRKGVLEVRSGKRDFLIATAPGRARPWVLHNNQVRGWIMAHRKRIDAIADDTKHEIRTPRREKSGLLDRLDTLTHRYRQRMDNHVKTAARHLANYADRCGVREVRLDFSDKRYCPDYTWARLAKQIAYCCGDLGIACTDSTGASGDVVDEE